MLAAEAAARTDGHWLLILDTQVGSEAEHLYRSLGWNEVGVIPYHSMLTDGTLAPAIYFWKDLR